MGFLSRILDDVTHPFGLGHSQPAQTGRPAPAITPPPSNNGGLQVSTAPNNQQISVAPPPQINPAQLVKPVVAQPNITVAPPTPQPPLTVAGGWQPPATATQVYHDHTGAVTGWEDNQGSHLSPYGQQQQNTALNPPPQPQSLGDHLRGILSAANNAVVKPVTNTVMGDIVYPTDSLIASATGDHVAQQIADQKAQEAQAGSLPQMLVKPFADLGIGLAYTPKAIYREIQNKPINDIQQRVFGTTDSGQIGKKIVGDTAAAELTVAAPELFGAADAAAAPVVSDISNPVVSNLVKAGIKAGVGAPYGASYNVAATEGSNPNATPAELRSAAEQGAIFGGVLTGAPDVVRAGNEGTSALVQYAKDHPMNEIGAVGRNVNEPPAPIPNEPNPINPQDLNQKLTNQIDNSRGAAGQPVPKAPPEVQQVIDAARNAIKAGDINGANTLAESLPTKYATPLKAELSSAPMPADFLTSQLDNARGNAGKPKPTGIVDKQLQKIQDTKNAIINTAVDSHLQSQAAAPDVHAQIRAAGGISSSDHESLPSSLKNKNGLPMDEMAANLGFPDDQALMDAIDARQAPLTKAQAREQVVQQLESGQHPFANDYATVKAAEQARQNELALYPKGTRSQVKVTDNKGAISDAELQSLSKTPEGTAKPAGKPSPAAAGASELRNPDAERAVLDSLQKGHNTETVLQNYMDATGAGLQKAVRDVNRVASEAGLTTDLGKNPLEGSLKLPEVQKGDWKQATLNSRFVQYKEQELGSKALNSYDALSTHDQTLLKQIEENTVSQVAKQAENPGAFKQAAGDLRTYFDTRHSFDKTLGIDVGYRTNYIRHFIDQVENAPNEAIAVDQAKVSGADKAPGYTKTRTAETLAKDVRDALERDINGSSFNHAKLAYENGLNDALGGQVSHSELVRDKVSGEHYTQLQHPFGKDLAVPDSIAKEINRRVWQQDDGKISQAYDKINHGMKYIKLSGGLFHAFTESGNFLGQQLASGKMFTDPAATAKMVHAFFSDKAMQSEVARMTDAGVLDKAHLSGLTTSPKEILADVNVPALEKGTSKVAKATGIQQMHDATFQREIPYAKLKIFEQKTQGLDPMNPADLAKMRDTAKGINNLFGGINREIHGITPKWFKIAQKGLLATDFTEGKFSTLGKAVSDKGAAGTLARQAIAGKVLLWTALATAGAAAGGEFKGDNKGQTAKNIAGKFFDPNFEIGGYKVGLPKTHVSEVVDALKPTEKNGKAWNASGVVNYFKDRSAALPSEAIQLLTNKNYYGAPIYGTNQKKAGGGKIGAGQTAVNVANTVLPIPFGQVTNTASGKQNPAAAAANVIGFKAKPNPDNTKSFDGTSTTLNDQQTKEYQGLLNSTTNKITSQLTNSDAFKKASPNDQAKALSELKGNITDATNRQFAAKYNLGQFAPDYQGKGSQASQKIQDITSGNINPDAYVKGTNNSDSYQVAQFKKSNAKLTTIGDQTYYKKGDGTVAHKDTFSYQNDIKTADLSYQLDRAKAGNDYKSWTDAASQRLDQIQSMIPHYDPTTEADKIDSLKKEALTLVNDMQKYNSYGGQFTKPPKGRKGASSNGISYKFFNPTTYEKSLQSLLAAAKVT